MMRARLLCLVGTVVLLPTPAAADAATFRDGDSSVKKKRHGRHAKKKEQFPAWLARILPQRRETHLVVDEPQEGLEWIDTKDPSRSYSVLPEELTLAQRLRPMQVPYTVWSFGVMPASAREAFCRASRNWGASGAYVWHMPAVERLLDRHPGWKEVWPRMPRTVMKSDIARYLVAYEYGGTYADYDVVGRSPPPAGEDTSLVLQVEQTLERWQVSPKSATGREKHYLQRIAQYYFSVEPKHRFFEMVLEEALARVGGLLDQAHKDWADKWVLWSTGPDVITTIYHEHFENDTSVVLTKQDTIAKHLSAGAWKRGKDTATDIHPAPAAPRGTLL